MALYQVEMQSLKADLDLQLLEAAKRAANPADAPKSQAVERGPEDDTLDAQVALAEAAVKRGRGPRAGPDACCASRSMPGELSAGHLARDGRRLVDGRDGRGLSE